MRIIASHHHQTHSTSRAMSGYDSDYDEVPRRADVILEAVSAAGVGPVSPPVDHGLAPILAVHDRDLVEFLHSAFQRSRDSLPGEAPLFPNGYYAVRGWRHQPTHWQQQAGFFAIDRDSPILAGTWDAAYWSAQTALSAASLVQAGAGMAYALCRPPGHHASASQYGGYCYLNNAAIAARHVQGSASTRVAVVDIDYHHGNGTQEIFYADPTVLYCSLHGDPDAEYPYFWGGSDELGSGAGLGFNRNWPLPAGTGDDGYLRALDEALAAVSAFQPGYLVVSAGFDLLAGDPVATTGGFRITPYGLEQIGRRLAGLDIQTVIIQEGGYQIDRLGEMVVRFLRQFIWL